MSGMSMRDESGEANILMLPLIVSVVLVFGVLIFAGWAYQGRQDYKNNVDKKVAAAVEVAQQETSAQKDKEFAEKDKSPLKAYNGPSEYGSLVIQYPKAGAAMSKTTGGAVRS